VEPNYDYGRTGFSVRCIEGVVVDCAGVADGTATVDNCDDCVGGTTGADACVQDCNGDWGGTAVVDCAGLCGGTSVDADSDGICDELQGTTTDIDGNEYKTIKIGEQWWMAENLRTTNDNQGNAIDYYCYENNLDNCDDYGRLYTWDTLNNNEICPIGWHVPSDSAFTTLERYICSDILGNDDCENAFPYVQEYNVWRGSNEAGAIKDGEIEFPPGWIDYEEVQSDNQTGFSALPGGIYFTGGYYANKGQSAYLWASSLSEDDKPYFRTLTYDSQQIRRDATLSSYGMSVRCLKD